MPHGAATKAPEMKLTLTAMVPRHTRIPNAAKEYIRFMMEAEQYDSWLTGCLGYWSQPLMAYGASAIWSSDPKLKVYSDVMNTPFYDGFRGPITAATGAVVKNWIVVGMFFRVVTGQQDARSFMRDAQRAAERWYRRW
jgi:multiple sugar transport system substrate-binding protein